MSKILACLCAIMLTVSVGASAEVVSFTAVDSQATAGLVSYTATVTGGFTLISINWDGFASTINSGTWGSELRCDVSGPLGTTYLTLGSGSTYAPGAAFAGTDSTLTGDPVGVWTFDFYESYDDGADGLPDATWDTIDFDFSDLAICVGPDDCASAQLLTESYNPGDTTNCSDTFPSYSLWAYPVEGNDHVYAIEIPCPGYEVCVNLYPNSEQDLVAALSNECVDGPVTAVAGADDYGYGWSGEYFCYTTTAGDASTMYIYVDSHGEGAAGSYSLSVYLNGLVPNDECWQAINVGTGGTFSGTTVCARNFVDVTADCIDYATSGPEAVYSFYANDGDTLDLTLTPTTGWDPALYVISDCYDPVGSCVGGADAGLTGDPETATLTFNCAGYYYIMADSYYSSGSLAEGDFDLDVVITPATPVDTFDVSMVCDSGPLTLPTQASIRVYVTNTFTSTRQFCGNVGVTTCSGAHISNLRAGNMVALAGETKFIGWGQYIPALPPTCGCTLVFDVDATDCTPCADAGLDAAGWNETATCGVTTYCP